MPQCPSISGKVVHRRYVLIYSSLLLQNTSLAPKRPRLFIDSAL